MPYHATETEDRTDIKKKNWGLIQVCEDVKLATLCDHFWEENELEWKHKWDRQRDRQNLL